MTVGLALPATHMSRTLLTPMAASGWFAPHAPNFSITPFACCPCNREHLANRGDFLFKSSIPQGWANEAAFVKEARNLFQRDLLMWLSGRQMEDNSG